jgi:hypothetical protein
MKITRVTLTTASVALCLGAFARAAEKKISKSDLPPAVAKTAEQVSKGAIVKAYSQDNENGTIEFEVETVVNGHSKDIAIGMNGDVLEVEEQVQLTGLPVDVQVGLKAKAGSGSITKVESITKKGKIVAYEAQVRTGEKHSEIQVGPDGKPLDHEE